MKKTAILLISTLFFGSLAVPTFAQTAPGGQASPAAAQAKDGQKETKAEQAPIYDESADARADIAAAVARAGKENRRVLVHWGANWCGWCKRLEAWMAGPDVAPLLAREFVDLKIDQDRMVGGQEIKGRFPGSEKAGIPWFAVLSPDGKILVDSSFQGSNIGFPATDEEIAAFGEFLKEGTKALSEAEIQKLLDTLKQPQK